MEIFCKHTHKVCPKHLTDDNVNGLQNRVECGHVTYCRTVFNSRTVRRITKHLLQEFLILSSKLQINYRV